MPESALFAETALLPAGWRRNVLLTFDADGDIASVDVGAEPGGAARAAGPLLPGMPNLHSHAFQRAMAGLAERAANPEDSFWTWREVMYGFVAKVTPEQLEAIAAQLYLEMAKAGYTAVGEFHYLHHQPDGTPYANLPEMALRTVAAARQVGLGITQLPVLYGYGGFGGQPVGEGQKRFANPVERFVQLTEKLMRDVGGDPQVAVGIAPHSLRAVTPESLSRALEALDALALDAPVHIHIAEQTKEVEDCLAWCGQRPVEWLLDAQPLGERWCLVHATHMTPDETARLARSGAVAGLCPTTEANLGDGLFPAPDYWQAEGRWGVGSDSHISISPVEELRWLEYGQRLVARRRNMLRDASGHVGAGLYKAALAGGAQALGRATGAIAIGHRADFVVIDAEHPLLAEREDDLLLDALVFSGNQSLVRDVMIGGRWVVEQGHHKEEEAIAERYRAALRALTA